MNKEATPLNKKNTILGVWYGCIAFAAWGILPVYWKQISQVSPFEILSHRIIWSFVFILIIVIANRQMPLKLIKEELWKNKLFIVLASLFIGINWLIYIWAVNSDHIVDASLGYYINPLFSVALGVIFLREKLNTLQYASIFLALIGVLNLTLHYGKFPWIALGLAVSFGLYGLVKKKMHIDAATGLVLETFILLPAALIYLLLQHVNGNGSFGTGSIITTLFLTGAGIITAFPLLWFARATQLAPLSTVGFTQYLSPSISLIVGVFMYGEKFTRVHAISFGLIWIALILFSCARLSLLNKFSVHFSKNMAKSQ